MQCVDVDVSRSLTGMNKKLGTSSGKKGQKKGHEELNRPARVVVLVSAFLCFLSALSLPNALQCMYDSTSHTPLFCLEASIGCWDQFSSLVSLKKNLST